MTSVKSWKIDNDLNHDTVHICLHESQRECIIPKLGCRIGPITETVGGDQM